MDYFLKASVVMAVFYICYYIFLRKETFFKQNRWFLLIGLVVSVLFPMIIIPVHVMVEPQPMTHQLYSYTENTQLINNEVTETFDWATLVIGSYIIGLIIFLIQFLCQFGSLIWLLLTNPKNKDGIYTYVIVNNKISPFSFFKWIVYNPKSFSKTELDLMLIHEKVHASQLHSIDILFAQLACSIFWFNPLIWFYRNDIRQNLEYIADFETQVKSSNNKEYQHLLLKTSVADQQISLSNNFYNSLIKERIVMLKKSRSNRKKQWRYLLMLPVLAGLFMSMNTETVYVPTEDYLTMESNTLESTDNKHIEILFNKDTTDEQIQKIKDELNTNGITMTIKRLKRNNKNEIIDIDVDFKTENGSANYNVSSDEGIKPFKFSMSDDGSFGVSSVNSNAMVIEDVIIEKLGESKPNVFFYNEGDENEFIEIIEDSSKVYEIRVTKDKGLHKDHDIDTDVHVVRGYKTKLHTDTLYVVKDFDIDTSKVHKKLKMKNDYYFEGDKKFKIRTTDKKVKILSPGDKVSNQVSVFRSKNPKPIIIVDGKVVSDEELGEFDVEYIDNVNVLKGKSAMEIYGDKGKNGVIVIEMKDGESKKIDIKGDKITWTTKDNQDGPWKVETGVSGYTFISTDDLSENATLGLITKETPDSVLDSNKSNLEELGITVKYSKLKRNKAGEITSIKITLKNDKGDQSSATYKDDDGITDIEYGVIGDKLIVRSFN